MASQPWLNMDTRLGLLASEQRLRGHSNPLTQIIIADSADLSRDRLVTISWWPPAQQAIAYWLRTKHLSLGEAVKTIVIACWIIGLAGWVAWFATTVRDPRFLPWLVTGFVLLRPSHTSGFIYIGGDTVMWAVFPVVAVLNVLALRTVGTKGVILAVLSGAAAGLLVLVRYVGGILAIGLAIAWLWRFFRRRVSPVFMTAWFAAAAATVAVAYRILSPLVQHTPASESFMGIIPVMLGVSASGPLLAISDVVEALTTVMSRLQRPLPSYGTMGLLSVTFITLFLTWLLAGYRRRPEPPSEGRRTAWILGVCVVLATSIGLAALWIRGAVVSWEGRHQQYGAFLLLPFLWESAINSVRLSSGWRRLVSALCVVVFVAFPIAYGVGTLARRSLFPEPGSKAAMGPTGVPLYWTAGGPGAAAFRSEIEALPGFHSALLATPAVEVALTFPEQRVLIVLNDFVLINDMPLSAGFRGRPDAVVLIAPPWEPPAVTERIRHAFVDVQQWTQIPSKSAPSTQLWLGK